MTDIRKSRASSRQSELSILEAALSLVVSEGYEGTTMAGVAKASGLPIGSLYWHFKNKEQLFSALIEYCFEDWKSRHRGPSNRAILRESIAGSAAKSRSSSHAEEAFWVIGLLLALERRLEDNSARKKYLEIREEMFSLMVQTIQEELPEDAVRAVPDLARKVVMLGRALTDGFYVSAAAGDDIDFGEAAELSALAVEQLVKHLVAEARHE